MGLQREKPVTEVEERCCSQPSFAGERTRQTEAQEREQRRAANGDGSASS